MRYVIAAALLLTALTVTPVKAGCLLCALGNAGAVVNGMQQPPPPPQYYVPQYVPQEMPPVQFHNYILPGGRQLNCTTSGGPSSYSTDCW